MITSSTAKISTETPYISTEFASQLAVSFIENTLFLKNQVPFPIAQLSRVQSSRLDKRAEKHRVELLESFDLLSSHLGTTFSALSTAIARCTKRPKAFPAYLLVIVGPTASTMSAGAKLVLSMETLEARIWGELDASEGPEDSDTDGEEEDDDDESVEESDEEFTDDEESDSLSKSSSIDSPSKEEETRTIPPITNHAPPSNHRPPPPSAPLSQQTRTTRSLARALATVLNDGEGIGSDLAPTLTHILILAPRRFNHPAWLPRQQLGSGPNLGLGILDDFFTSTRESEESTAPRPGPGRGKPQKVRTEGLMLHGTAAHTPDDHAEENEDEEDDMIWWSWDGKLVGFSG